MSASPSYTGSPSLGMSDVAMPLLFQFLVVDAASAIDYSKDSGFEDGIVDSPPAKVANSSTLHLPSPKRSTFILLTWMHHHPNIPCPRAHDRADAFAWMRPALMSQHLQMSLSCLYLPPSISPKLKPTPSRRRCPTVDLLKFSIVVSTFVFLGFFGLASVTSGYLY